MRFLVLLILLSPAVQACDSVFLGGISYHFDRSKDYNERHHMVGCANAIGRWDVMYFRNSKRRDSFYIGDYKSLIQFRNSDLGVDYGLVSGYKDRLMLFGDVRFNYHLSEQVLLNVRYGLVVFVAGLELKF